MDRTSILGDTINYVKELMDRIKTIQDEAGASSPGDLKILNTLGTLTVTAASSSAEGNETMLTRNSPRVSP